MTGLGFPKPRPAARQDRRTRRKAVDERESAQVRLRSNGQCEVWEEWTGAGGSRIPVRCARRAVNVMHLIGGRGRRGIGISALKEHKLHGCIQHHREIDGDIGGKKLKRIGGPVPLWTDCYTRVRP